MNRFGAEVIARSLAAVVLLFFWLTACERGHIFETAHKSTTSARPSIVLGDSLVQAEILSYVQPEYPMWARRKHFEGTVQLRATIGKDGRPRDLVFVNGPKQLAPTLTGQCANSATSQLSSMVCLSR